MSPAALCNAPSCDHPAHNGFLCTGCRDTLTKDLQAIPDLLDDLEVTISRQDHIGTDESRHTGTDERPLPLRLGPMEARRDLISTLVLWSAHIAVRHSRQLTFLRCLTSDAPADIARWLLENLAGVDSNPSAGQLADEIGFAVIMAQRTVDKPLQVRYAGPCDLCTTDLYAHPRADTINCRGCEATYRVDSRREWLLEQAEYRLLTATEMSRAIPGLLPRDANGQQQVLTAAMIRGWAHRGRLLQHPGHPARPDDPLYRVSDVINLCADQHKQDLAS